MTKFCKTHVKDRSLPEIRERRRELEARDLTDKPGLVAELERVREREVELTQQHEQRRAENPPVYAGKPLSTCVFCQRELYFGYYSDSGYMEPDYDPATDPQAWRHANGYAICGNMQNFARPEHKATAECIVCQVVATSAADQICDECRELSRTFGASAQFTEELTERPLDLPPDPEDAPILKAVIEEFERRYREEPQRLAEIDEGYDSHVPDPQATNLRPSDAYKLGVADSIAYFRQLANGPTFEVQFIEAVDPDASV